MTLPPITFNLEVPSAVLSPISYMPTPPLSPSFFPRWVLVTPTCMSGYTPKIYPSLPFFTLHTPLTLNPSSASVYPLQCCTLSMPNSSDSRQITSPTSSIYPILPHCPPAHSPSMLCKTPAPPLTTIPPLAVLAATLAATSQPSASPSLMTLPAS